MREISGDDAGQAAAAQAQADEQSPADAVVEGDGQQTAGHFDDRRDEDHQNRIAVQIAHVQ